MSSMASTQSLERKPLEGAPAADVAPAKKNKARPYIILGAVVGLALAVYLLIGWLGRGKETTDDAQVDGDVVAVSARVSGAVLKVHVTDNEAVTRGQLLVEIDPADYTA